MGYASREALVEYTQKKKGDAAFLSILGVFGVIMGIVFLTQAKEMMHFVFGVFFAVVGVWMIMSNSKDNSSYKSFLSTAQATGEMQRLLDDFAASRSMADDRIRLGANYLYGKQMGRPIQYTELRKVYPYVVTGTNTARYLKGVTSDGSELMLCEFIVHRSPKDPHPDESAIYQHILSKNPNVYLGYK